MRMVVKIKGAKGLMVALDPAKFKKSLKGPIRKATALNGKLAEASMRKVIQEGIRPGNAELTQAIKGGDKPLVDSSEMFGAITSKVVSDTEAFVGVLRTSGVYDVAKIVHEGITINVTPAMRGMFFFLWKASTGGMDPSKLTGRAAELWERNQDWKPLSPTTTVITIPARRFINAAFARRALKTHAKQNWERALNETFRRRAAEGRAAE